MSIQPVTPSTRLEQPFRYITPEVDLYRQIFDEAEVKTTKDPQQLSELLELSPTHQHRLQQLQALYNTLLEEYPTGVTVILIIGGMDNQNYPQDLLELEGRKILILITDYIDNLPPDVEEFSEGTYYWPEYDTFITIFETLIPTNYQDSRSDLLRNTYDEQFTEDFWNLMQSFFKQSKDPLYIDDYLLMGKDKSGVFPEYEEFLRFYEDLSMKQGNINIRRI